MKSGVKKKRAPRVNTKARIYIDPKASYSEYVFLDLLHTLEVERGERRVQSAQELLKLIAGCFEHGKPLPKVASDWLGQALARAVYFGIPADVTLGLKVGRGRKLDTNKALERAAHLHLLVACGAAQIKAADCVSGYFEIAEASQLIKSYNTIKKQWTVEVPLLWDRAAQKWADGNFKDLSMKSPLWVRFISPGIISSASFSINQEFIDYVMKCRVFDDIG